MSGNTAAATKSQGTVGQRYAVLDALRFVLALWVTIGHYEIFPLFAGLNEATPIGRFVVHAWQSIVFGTPAVIVFFVISGFCIHLPYRGDAELNIGKYYVRRYTRILIPVVGALCVYRFVGQRFVFWGEHSILWQSPLWSLLCEEIYYAVYPLLRRLRRAVSWPRVILAAFVVSVGVAATRVYAASWHDLGALRTAVILLPVWLLGCLLAEEVEVLPALGDDARWRIWALRVAMWFASWVAEMLHFKAHVSYTQTMAWFGLIAYVWVKNEIAYGKRHRPSRVLAWAGLWSYSLYLVHPQTADIWFWLRLPGVGPRLTWCGVILCSLFGAYIFYLVVERPSHQLARRLGRMGIKVDRAKSDGVDGEGIALTPDAELRVATALAGAEYK